MNETPFAAEAAANSMATSRPLSPREQRIKDYMETALTDPDPLAANLGLVNSDLMRLAHVLMQKTETALGRSAEPMRDFPMLLPAIETHLKISRQIDRFAQLELHVRAGRKSPATSAPGSTARPSEPTGV